MDTRSILFLQALLMLFVGLYITLYDISDFNLFGYTGNYILEKINGEEGNLASIKSILGILGLFFIAFSILELILLSSTFYTKQ